MSTKYVDLGEVEIEVDGEQTPHEIVKFIQSSGLDHDAACMLQNAFAPLFAAAQKWQAQASAIKITDASQTREMKLARESRLALREIRLKAEKLRKAMKEDSLRRGKAIDGLYNVIEFLIAPLEKHLMDQEQFVERMEAERKARLHSEREALLKPLVSDTTPYALGEMDEDAWNDLYNGAVAAAKEREAIASKAEEERLAREKADAEERARMKAENERLRAEAAKAEKERAAAQAKLQKERAALEKLARAEAAKAKAAKEAAAKAKRAPDRDKLLNLASAVRKIELPDATTAEGKDAMMEARDRIHALAKWIEGAAADL